MGALRVLALSFLPFLGLFPLIAGKKKHTPPCSSEDLFALTKEMGATEERFWW